MIWPLPECWTSIGSRESACLNQVSGDEQAVSDIIAMVAVKKWENLFKKSGVEKKFILLSWWSRPKNTSGAASLKNPRVKLVENRAKLPGRARITGTLRP